MSGIITPSATDFIPLCTAQDVKDQLKITTDLTGMETRWMERVINAATLWIENGLHRRIKTRAYSGTTDGNGLDVMYPRDAQSRCLCPITALSSLTVNGVAVTEAPDYQSLGWLLYGEAGYIRLLGYLFTSGHSNVTLSLTAGFATVPPVLVQGCCELVAANWQSRDKQDQNIQSISEMGQTVTFRSDMLRKETRDGMLYYRKLPI